MTKSFDVIKRLNRERFHMMAALIKNRNGKLLADTNEQLNLWATKHYEAYFNNENEKRSFSYVFRFG